MLLVLLAFAPIIVSIWPAITHLVGNGTLLAMANFADKRVTAAVLLFLLVGMAMGVPYRRWIKRSTGQSTATKAA